jgi:peptidoglycan/xylan/chitin deacetylase (PgdA/CDA1 family)/SAM-dependent methyltransferase
MEISATGKHKMISIFDTTVCDNNLGNQIIMDSVNKYMNRIFPSEFFIKLPYLDNIGSGAIKYLKESTYIFLGGTNALSSEMKNYKQIGIEHHNYLHIKNIILAGVGWWQYQGPVSAYTQKILKHCLHANIYHSVRDSYTKNKLSTVGINNVLVTGCPTLWQLTEEHCKKIKKEKSENVLLTFTNYSQDKSDLELLNILKGNYKNIFFWIQGPEDLEYAQSFGTKLNILPPNLQSLDKLLCSDIDIDYIGTRCHAGIRAMQFMRRSIIIGVDNRAIEMQKDFNLPVVSRTALNTLPEIINSKFETRLNLPFDKIRQWIRQFQKNNNNLVTDEMFNNGINKRLSLRPLSKVFGFDRGTPIDRYYIENFLNENRHHIHGRVLEIANSTYTEKYGTGVTKSDVLNSVPSPDATIVGDLSIGENIPDNTFDCIILTQTLHVVYNIQAAIKNAFKALKPNGVLLLTAPGISQISRYDMDRWGDYWRFTDKSLKMLFAESIPQENIHIETHGNVAVAKAFLDGLALQELPKDILDYNDNDYQVLLTARVRKTTLNTITDIYNGPEEKDTNILKTPLILLYHRVADDPIDSQLLTVSPENFEAHLKELTENYRVLPLHQLLKEASKNQLEPNTLAITFDDGYLDNLTNAVPLLEKYGLHATIFIVSGMVGSQREFWWDDLERIFLTGHPIPSLLSIQDSQGLLEWDLTTTRNRLKAYDELCEMLRVLPSANIDENVNQLLIWAGLMQTGRSTHQVLNVQQLKLLASSASVEIGSHSITHTRLSSLPPQQQQYEIAESKKQLEAIIEKPVRLFSYPYGGLGDITKETGRILAGEGYEAGIANVQGSLVSPIDMYAVPRRLVRNWTGTTFAQWLRDRDKASLEAKTLSERVQKIINCSFLPWSKQKQTIQPQNKANFIDVFPPTHTEVSF